MTRFLRTDPSATLALQRVVLGLVLLAHGLQKTAGWFGGYGFQGTMAFFTGTMGFPWIVALLVVLAESAGALGLVLGAGTRLGALGVALVMLGAITTHVPNGFFMNWSGAQAGEGFEFHLLALALAVPLAVRGGGRWSLDGALAARLGGARRPEGAAALEGA